MLAMSNPNVNPGGVETQQMQIKAPVGVCPFPHSRLLSVSRSLTRLMVFLALPVPASTQTTYLILGQWATDTRPSRFLWVSSKSDDRWPAIYDHYSSSIDLSIIVLCLFTLPVVTPHRSTDCQMLEFITTSRLFIP